MMTNLDSVYHNAEGDNDVRINNFELNALQNTELEAKRKSIPLGDQNKAVLRQEFMVLLMNLGLLTGGISLALPSVTLDQLKNSDEDVHLNKDQESWYSSCSSLGSPLGAILCAFIMDRYGRKTTLIVTNILGVITWALMAFPLKGYDSDVVIIQLMASRVISGIVKGLGGAAVSVYGAEICLPRIRARLITSVSMAFAGGVLFIFILGYFIRNDWRLLGIILLGYQIVCLISLIPVIESPSWLISKGYFQESKASLSFFRGLEPGETHTEVEAEFLLLANKFKFKGNERKTSFWKSLSLQEVYKPLMLAFIFYVLQQFAGTFIVIVYAVQILEQFGMTVDVYRNAVYLGIARFFVATFIMTWELEKWSRRQVGIFSALSMACCVFVLAALSLFTPMQMPYLYVAVIIVFVITSAGIWALPFVICSEIFPQNVRGACCGITDSIAYLLSFFAIKLFPSMVDGMGIGNVFAFYGVIALLTAVFMFLYIPETKDKTLLEIEEYFQSKNKIEHKNNADEEMKELFVQKNIAQQEAV